MNYLEILHKLKSLDLANKLSSDEIKKLINGLGFYTYKRIFKKGEFIIRTRPNYNGTFCAKSELSYPPKSKESQSHQRASLKNTNYFYGSLIGNNYSVFQNHKDFIGAIVTSISEQEFFKDEKNKCIYKITYGAWQVKKEFGVAVLVQNENFYDKSDYVKMIIDEYNIYISTQPEEKKNEIILVNKFICNEFGKQVKKGEEYDYLISASYTQRMFEEGLGGLIYPSFTMLGAGLNIVLKTEIVDNCLELVRAGECTIFKTSSGINVSHDRVASRIVSDGNFTFDINGTNKGKIACMFQAGIR
ncbi:MAG: hypothetical protein PHC62_10355 [Candidatus Izemoplasmatales bacterium]|nr:hypothetical protein [Candidatus Izemoplasmatales bacterium]